jgi:hypothetical protein
MTASEPGETPGWNPAAFTMLPAVNAGPAPRTVRVKFSEKLPIVALIVTAPAVDPAVTAVVAIP